MDYKRFGNTIIARMDKGEEILQQLEVISQKENIRLASVSALGATNDMTVGVFRTGEKKYYANHFTGDMEIVSLTGTVSTMDGNYYAHLHMSAGDADGHVFGGHLNRCVISATCEMVIQVIDGEVDREFNQEVGLNTFRFH
jgi:predicted DNA-binding protein with PD1-like motif